MKPIGQMIKALNSTSSAIDMEKKEIEMKIENDL